MIGASTLRSPYSLSISQHVNVRLTSAPARARITCYGKLYSCFELASSGMLPRLRVIMPYPRIHWVLFTEEKVHSDVPVVLIRRAKRIEKLPPRILNCIVKTIFRSLFSEGDGEKRAGRG